MSKNEILKKQVRRMRTAQHSHSLRMPTFLHHLSRQDGHLRRIHISILQSPLYLHTYLAPRVMLLRKNPERIDTEG